MNEKPTPTPKQAAVLRFIKERIRSRSMPPTLREIAEHEGIAVSSAHFHVRALRAMGLLDEADPRSSRSSRPVVEKNSGRRRQA